MDFFYKRALLNTLKFLESVEPLRNRKKLENLCNRVLW